MCVGGPLALIGFATQPFENVLSSRRAHESIPIAGSDLLRCFPFGGADVRIGQRCCCGAETQADATNQHTRAAEYGRYS